MVFLFVLPLHGAPKDQWPIISVGTDTRIVYNADDGGNRVPDFSHCGYAGGNRSIPDAPVRVVVAPAQGDSTARIQKAIDYIAGLPLDTNGLRGAVLLLKGRHELLGGLIITNSGVVLRGQGIGESGTLLMAAGLDRRTLIRIVGRNDRTNRFGRIWEIKDDCVPVGATGFRLKDTSGLEPGDSIRLVRPSTQAWIERLAATEFGGGVGGGWKPGTRDLVWDRIIKSIEGDKVTVDVPITTAIEGISNSGRRPGNVVSNDSENNFGGGFIMTYDWPGRINNIGVEHLQLESTFDPANPKDENHSWCAITMENAADAWVRQVTFKHFAGSAIAIYENCQRVTVQDGLSLAPVSEDGGYRRHTFFTMGQQTLFLRCYAERGRHDFSVGHCATGPNAFVQCEAHLPLGDSGPIESWASGVLYDNVTIDGQALTLGYRAGSGAAVGWAAANSVLWQCNAAVIRCWNPPTARNWAFGSWAGFEGDGLWRSSNDFVSPDSLYAGQLRDRLGADAANRLKLMPRPHEESSNPPVDKAQELAATSHQPAPQLADYIAHAGKRDPIPSEPGDAKRIEEISSFRRSRGDEPQTQIRNPESGIQTDPTLLTSVPTKKLVLTNGWVMCDGKLLIGGNAGVSWWRGNIRPNEAPSFGLGVTRFVPGRIGPGFTDDLDDVADFLVANGQAALDYNYGLWHERRRDDHERVRRMTGDVLPPFYELPFVRSGQGTAWDGLSKYDLTKFNPWYWSRLKEFAGICDQRGLVLFHQNYFQHNILEAGAHWADFPWRSANNINNTGFPEPPPYAGDKRIFMAELFYDVMHPVRRELHRRYIRQCLDNFTNNANVIQFTSAEFTGPLQFMEFWLDTIAEWEREKTDDTAHPLAPSRGEGVRRTGEGARFPLVALSCTKDVQDAILDDPKRSAIVDVIDFRYWWQTSKGLFAPPGGKNLAPRQFERQWRGGRPTDTDLAQMVTEYRQKYPGKAVICDFDSASWAYVCAGGSLPRLPKTTDAKLLAAIPRMKPFRLPDAPPSQFALAESDQAYLIYAGSENPVSLDLSQVQGQFTARSIDPRTGLTTGDTRQVTSGGNVRISVSSRPTVLWLTRNRKAPSP